MENENEALRPAPDAPAEEALFRNTVTMGYSEYLQAIREMLRRNSKISGPFVWAEAAVLALLAVYFLARHGVSSTSFPLAVALIALAGLLIFLYVGLPRIQAKGIVKRSQEAFGGPPVMDTFFYADGLLVRSRADKAELRYAYDVFAACMETEDLFLLQTKQKQAVTLGKAGFSGTDEHAFRAFIEKKLPGAKFYWKNA